MIQVGRGKSLLQVVERKVSVRTLRDKYKSYWISVPRSFAEDVENIFLVAGRELIIVAKRKEVLDKIFELCPHLLKELFFLGENE